MNLERISEKNPEKNLVKINKVKTKKCPMNKPLAEKPLSDLVSLAETTSLRPLSSSSRLSREPCKLFKLADSDSVDSSSWVASTDLRPAASHRESKAFSSS